MLCEILARIIILVTQNPPGADGARPKGRPTQVEP